MKTQKCPHCGEENPVDAVMCWACYTPIGAAKASVPRPEPAPADEKPLGDKVKRWLSDGVPYAAVASSIASGWLPRKMRLPVLGASLSVLSAEILHSEWQNRLNKAEFDDPARARENQKTPAVRIAETILFYAWKEKSAATRIVENGQSVKVRYLIKGEWHEQMVIPRDIWKPIRQQLLRFARQGDFPLGLSPYEYWHHDPSKLTNFRARLEVDTQSETLNFQFECAPLEAATGNAWFDNPPDVKCFQCGESNVSDAVWCWNCGADLRQQSSASDKKYPILSALLFVGFAIAASSGWWTRRARWPILGAGASLIASLFAFDKWDERQKRRRDNNYKKRGVTQM